MRRGRYTRAKAKVAAVEPAQPVSESVVVGISLSSQGYSVSKQVLGDSRLAELKRELTMTPMSSMAPGNGPGGGAPPVSFPLYRESSNKLYVPKHFGLTRFGAPKRCTLDEGQDIAAGVVFTGGMRAEQLAPANAWMDAAKDPKRMGGILSLPCGSGKTVIALWLVGQLRKRTLIVVHKDFLLQQWRERIAEFLPGASVGILKAQKLDVEGHDIVIASLQSLSMKEYDANVFAGFGMLIIDECHRVGTEVFSRALHKTNMRCSLGLSATVQRKDGMTKAFIHFLGDVLFRVKRREDDVRVLSHRYHDPDPSYSDECFVFGTQLNISRMINNVCGWEPRTRVIAGMIRAALAIPGRKVLVLSDRKSQLADLKRILEEPVSPGGVDDCAVNSDSDSDTVPVPRPPPKCGFYVGGMKPEALAQSERGDVVLATFAFASEGFDAKDLDTLVLASPKTDIEQSVGRILRKKADQRDRLPTIIDVVDDFSVFSRQGAKRRAFYRAHEYTLCSTLKDTLCAPPPRPPPTQPHTALSSPTPPSYSRNHRHGKNALCELSSFAFREDGDRPS
jgi:hypothetical protein